jgi:hypothetical protein
VEENPKLELKEIEGRMLEGNIIYINAAGMVNGGLRGERDGQTYFGTTKTINGKVIIITIIFINNYNNSYR